MKWYSACERTDSTEWRWQRVIVKWYSVFRERTVFWQCPCWLAVRFLADQHCHGCLWCLASWLGGAIRAPSHGSFLGADSLWELERMTSAYTLLGYMRTIPALQGLMAWSLAPHHAWGHQGVKAQVLKACGGYHLVATLRVMTESHFVDSRWAALECVLKCRLVVKHTPGWSCQ